MSLRSSYIAVAVLTATIAIHALTCSSSLADQPLILKDWEVSIDNAKSFHQTTVPNTVENAVDVSFDGVSIYRTQIASPVLRSNQRAILRFAAVATQAKVFLNDKLLAEHLGGWTPFLVDITDSIKNAEKNQAAQKNRFELKVIVDEKVGHNTQGFLPVVTNHFSGIWQPVELWTVEHSWLLRDRISVQATSGGKALSLQLPVSTSLKDKEEVDQLRFELAVSEFQENEPRQWTQLDSKLARKSMDEKYPALAMLKNSLVYSGEAAWPEQLTLKHWSPNNPFRYALRIRLYSGETMVDEYEQVFGVREFETEGEQFKLNGNPVSLRGILNWGYSPPSLAPSTDPKWMRDEIEFAKARGFNLMKFCLFVPPKQYLELCDELGMLAWVEYPTWHPKLDEKHLAELRQEYAEFFAFDRNHPSVILRSLTCETGSSAELSVIQSLYDQCKSMIPGAVVEDDSSWISWNRVHDFYDDHPYGNNHTWVKTLASLREYMSSRATKPLALGEAIAADTWIEPSLTEVQRAAADKAHGSWSVADNQRWVQQLQQLSNAHNRRFEPEAMYQQSVHYGMLMRKFQIETFHREMPNAGYVVSVIRDFPKASMGLIDSYGRAKTTPEDWLFHQDRMLILKTENDRRSFQAGSDALVSILLKDLMEQSSRGTLSVDLVDDEGNRIKAVVSVDAESGKNTADGTRSVPATGGQVTLKFPQDNNPKRWKIVAKYESDGRATIENEWPIWSFPNVADRLKQHELVVHDSAKSLAATLNLVGQSPSSATAERADQVILASHFDNSLLDRIQRGGRVLMIPDVKPGSFPLQAHWFLRGSVVSLPKSTDRWHLPFQLDRPGKNVKQNMLVELQHFDLADRVVANMGHYLDSVDPMVVLWDNHDMRETRTHGLVFKMRLGDGLVLVSALNHQGETNSTGQWLLDKWLEELSCPLPVATDADHQLLSTLRCELNRKEVSLATDSWRFQVDADNTGITNGWTSPRFNDDSWSRIRIDRHWEVQGHASLDGWAWYRTNVEVDSTWRGGKTYLNLNGIDDYADIYVNGTKIASVGDIENKKTAFETRASYEISKLIKDDGKLSIAVAVYDWFGAGGIFRPITLSTEPMSESPPILLSK